MREMAMGITRMAGVMKTGVGDEDERKGGGG